jgi:hypothetical protein
MTLPQAQTTMQWWVEFAQAVSPFVAIIAVYAAARFSHRNAKAMRFDERLELQNDRIRRAFSELLSELYAYQISYVDIAEQCVTNKDTNFNNVEYAQNYTGLMFKFHSAVNKAAMNVPPNKLDNLIDEIKSYTDLIKLPLSTDPDDPLWTRDTMAQAITEATRGYYQLEHQIVDEIRYYTNQS